ncbi:MAG TPA: hypothetical protein VK466_06865, partial [Terriglobales bacterium]|nr:hypothetical protein [Terriglobales bacterium]
MTRFVSVLFALAFSVSVGWASHQPPAGAAPQDQPYSSSSPAGAMAEATHAVTGYTLPPELYRKAHERRRIHFR